MKFKSLLCLPFLGLAGVSYAANPLIEITGFGIGDFTALGEFGTDSQTATSYSISGSDLGSTLVGSFAVPYTVIGTPDLFLTGTLTFSTNPASGFQIGLYDDDGDALLYNANWSSFGVSNQEITLTLTFATADLSGNGEFSGQATTFVLATNGAGSTVNFTLNSLSVESAIPEPSSFAALAGLGILGVVATRRRRSV